MRSALAGFIIGVLIYWPFHHKHAPSVRTLPQSSDTDNASDIGPDPTTADAPGIHTPSGTVHFDDSRCPKNDDGYYFFLGPDGLIGIALDSCDGAFVDWNNNKGNGIVTGKA